MVDLVIILLVEVLVQDIMVQKHISMYQQVLLILYSELLAVDMVVKENIQEVVMVVDQVHNLGVVLVVVQEVVQILDLVLVLQIHSQEP